MRHGNGFLVKLCLTAFMVIIMLCCREKQNDKFCDAQCLKTINQLCRKAGLFFKLHVLHSIDYGY